MTRFLSGEKISLNLAHQVAWEMENVAVCALGKLVGWRAAG